MPFLRGLQLLQVEKQAEWPSAHSLGQYVPPGCSWHLEVWSLPRDSVRILRFVGLLRRWSSRSVCSLRSELGNHAIWPILLDYKGPGQSLGRRSIEGYFGRFDPNFGILCCCGPVTNLCEVGWWICKFFQGSERMVLNLAKLTILATLQTGDQQNR